MKTGFYPKLAWSGIVKNQKTTLPYFLTCIGMVMMAYIISFLKNTPTVMSMPGSDILQIVLNLGTGVIGIFSLIFLFYTHSFLIRRRKKEFGLYNILGMGKRNLARILIWESFILAVISLSGGLFCGILFSKVAELCMVRMLIGNIGFSFSIDVSSIIYTLVLFAVIFLLILLNTLRQIHVSKPVELLHGDTVGEKPPKAKWIIALLGAIILGGAYYISVTMKDPVSAIFGFFVAVVMVIIGTYLLFIAGSVAFCKLLQKRKGYYYKSNHFISVSSMVYRMNRNGAGLASICILSTMVLVMISSTACLFIGSEDIFEQRYPRNIVIDSYSMDEQYVEAVDQTVSDVLKENNLTADSTLHYRYLDISGYYQDDKVILDQSKLSGLNLSDFSQIKQTFFVPLADYNRMTGESETLADDEVLLYAVKSKYAHDTITFEGSPTMKVKKTFSKFPVGEGITYLSPPVFVIIPYMEVMETFFESQAKIFGDNRSFKHYYYAFDLNCDDQKQVAVDEQISNSICQLQNNDENFPRVSHESAAKEKGEFYALYGGFFFLGILLGIVFLFAAVLIMYYKQISEGYEDQSRFEIMQKVGMTKKEIRKSINSQVLTVFFLPLIIAGIHIAFAFPVISKLLTMFALTNTPLLIGVTIVCYLIFALFYTLVYRITSGAYYGIVSGKESKR